MDWERRLNDIDNDLIRLSRRIAPQSYRNPTNEESAKNQFFTSGEDNPSFTYKSPPANLDDVRREIQSLTIPDNPFKDLYVAKKEELCTKTEFVANVGTPAATKASETLYGEPTDTTINKAQQILTAYSPEDSKISAASMFSAQQIKSHFEELFEQYGLSDWQIELTDKAETTVYPSKKTLTIHRDRKLSNEHVRRLSVHEIGVHIVRTHNGYQQPTKLFGLGLPRYTETEEGMAIIAEQTVELPTKHRLAAYAARALSVHHMLRGDSFRTCYDNLREYDFSQEEAWKHTLRGYRAGGLCKDHLYLQGYLSLKKRMDSLPRNVLYVGKFGLNYLDDVQEFLEEGYLNEPDTVPSFWSKQSNQ